MKFVPYYTTTSSSHYTHRIKDSSLVWIALAVLFVHLFGVWLSYYSAPITPQKELRQSVVVRTVQLTPKVQTSAPLQNVNMPVALLESVPEPVLEPKEELKIVEEKKEVPPAMPLKKEEPVINPEPVVVEPEPVKDIPKPKPKEEPKKNNTPVPKKEVKPEEKKPAPKPKTQAKPDPKPVPAPKKVETKKPEVKKADVKKVEKPVPAKKPSEEVVKPKKEVKKEPTPEQIAAKEAEKAREVAAKEAAKEAEKVKQREIAAAKEAERVKQRELAAAQEAARAKQQELLAKAKEKIAKIGESGDKISANKISSLDDTKIPTLLANLQIDALPVGTGASAELGAREISYRDEVAYRMKSALRLPDNGEVKMKLILNRNGKVSKVQIMTSGSAKNKEYIEKTVPTLIFPDFGTRFGDASQYTFMITLNKE